MADKPNKHPFNARGLDLQAMVTKDAHKEALVCLDREIAPETVDRFKGDKQTFFICLELALDTTKKWNLKPHLSDRLNAM